MRGPLPFLEQIRRQRAIERAGREIEWFFGTLGGRVPGPDEVPDDERAAAQTIDGWLRRIPPFHRGALALRYDDREWPEALCREYQSWTSLVVRLECARRADGRLTPAALEREAVRTLEEEVARCAPRRKAVEGTHRQRMTPRERRLARRCRRAERHVRLAMRAYARARGDAHCVAPRGTCADGRGV